LSPKTSSLISDTFVGSEGIHFTPGFPVKGPKLGVLSSFVHMVAPGMKYHYDLTIKTFLGVSLAFTVTLFWAHSFSFSHRIVRVTLIITQISSGTLDKLSDNNSGRITSSVKNVFAR
jgi:hypothetical protein